MKIEYDREADALYVHLTEKPKRVAKSREVEDGIILDLDAKRKLLGIEVLDVSKRFKEANAFEFAVTQLEKHRSIV
ncbi:DUF2283 domain-containing protein [Candidatus Uhrbacteria bacterium]|nr:DUF2283 domain-containing protein [Candidatus Uhrbacteria bacterium]